MVLFPTPCSPIKTFIFFRLSSTFSIGPKFLIIKCSLFIRFNYASKCLLQRNKLFQEIPNDYTFFKPISPSPYRGRWHYCIRSFYYKLLLNIFLQSLEIEQIHLHINGKNPTCFDETFISIRLGKTLFFDQSYSFMPTNAAP